MSPAAREAMLFEDVAKRRKRVWRRLGGKVAWIWLEMRSKAYWTSEGLAPVTFPLAPLPTLNQDAANDVTLSITIRTVTWKTDSCKVIQLKAHQSHENGMRSRLSDHCHFGLSDGRVYYGADK
jgi:hypothetical protein